VLLPKAANIIVAMLAQKDIQAVLDVVTPVALATIK